MIHPGHLNFFKQAKEHGELIILVARDETVKAVKGSYPTNSEAQRQARLVEAGIAKKVVLGHKDDKYKVLEQEKPDFICLGYDQHSFVDKLEEEIKKRNLKTRIIRLKPYKEEIYKSSKLEQEEG